jgi:hypothetical protein
MFFTGFFGVFIFFGFSLAGLGERGVVPQEPFGRFFEDFVPEEPFFVKPAARRPGGGVFFDPKGADGGSLDPNFAPRREFVSKKGGQIQFFIVPMRGSSRMLMENGNRQ